MNQKTTYTTLIIFALLALLMEMGEGACHNYWNGDKIPNLNASSYCRKPLIIWPVSDLVLNDSSSRDAKAIQYYQLIYNNSYSIGEVDEQCLGVLQYTACAATYPTCANGDDSVENICSWVCQLMALRCGTDSKLYADACLSGNVSKTNCSHEPTILLSLLVLLILTLSSLL